MDLSQIFTIIKNGQYKRISIQLPENNDADPSAVISKIQEFVESNGVDSKIYLLGDVASGDCCVDRIAAKRCDSDLIIHHGYWCHTLYKNSCAIYHNYMHKPFRIEVLHEYLYEIGLKQSIGVIYDPSFHHLLPDIIKLFDSHPSVNIYKCFSSISEIGESTFEYNRIVSPKADNIDLLLFLGDSYYIDKPYPLLYKIALEIKSSVMLDCVYSCGLVKRNLNSKGEIASKRFMFIDKVKNSTRIGICTGTSMLRHANELRKYLSKLVTAAGKQPFSFIVGKINAMKLENFDSIDIFCPLLCPESILKYVGEANLSEKVLHRKIVFPFELLVALGYLPWSDEYIFDFERLIATDKMLESSTKTDLSSLGKTELACTSHNVYNMLLSNNERCFRGVDQDYNTDKIPSITKGLYGTASMYTKDVENK